MAKNKGRTNAPAPAPEQPPVTMIPIGTGTIRPSPFQNRKRFDDLDELAESIRTHGVLQPVTVRLVSDGQPELVFGERRLRAAIKAGLTEIPAFVRVLDDREAAELLLVENLRRADVRPLEEAEGIARLLELWTGDVAAAAAAIGVTAHHVARRAHLHGALAEPWRGLAADADSVVSGWTAAHLEVVARLSPSEQKALYEDLRYRLPAKPTVAHLEEAVGRHLRVLAKAPWRLDDNELLPDAGPCTTCPKRTSAAPLLFADLGDDKDRCRDGACFTRKLAAHVAMRRSELEAKGSVVLVETGYGGSETKGTVPDWQVERISKAKGGQPHLVIDGPKAGIVFYGRREKAYTETGTAGKRRPGRPKLASDEDRREALERRRWKLVADRLRAWIYPDAPSSVNARVPAPRQAEVERAAPPALDALVRLVACFGTSFKRETLSDYGGLLDSAVPRAALDAYRAKHGADVVLEEWARYAAYDPKLWDVEHPPLGKPSSGVTHTNLLVADLFNMVAPVLASRLRYYPHIPVGRLVYECRRIGQILGRDVDEMYREACAEIPAPKSWATPDKAATARSKAPAKRGRKGGAS